MAKKKPGKRITIRKRVRYRVGAICSFSETTKVLKFFGYGTYVGKEVPEDHRVYDRGVSVKEFGQSQSCIVLDNGEKIFGCECWWGPEHIIKEYHKSAKKVINIDINDFRSEAEVMIEKMNRSWRKKDKKG